MLAAGATALWPALAQAQRRGGEATPFSWDVLQQRAQALARQPYRAPQPSAAAAALDYDAVGGIRYRAEKTLAGGIRPFPLGKYAPVPVTINVVANGSATRVDYSPALFETKRGVTPAPGFAGFRVMEPGRDSDWLAYMGASYFRSAGSQDQYGLSARGIAIDVAVPDKPEEFPTFTRFHFEPPAEGSRSVTVYALLEGPSITGAFKFVMRRDAAVLMDIDCQLFLRKDVARLGIAPLTSMYWYSETVKPGGIDWRPEVHDSDGLAMWNGAGEHIWRPLNNPTQTRASAFTDTRPRGFGLLQRDRAFDHYQDGVFYEKRPSLWVEPLGDWGEGAVQLVEIPTDDEIHDNTVAFWVPKAPAKAGSSYALKYRLHWTDKEPFPSPLGRCMATRIGRGGQPGQPRPGGVRKFMVEFVGGPLAALPFGVKPELVLTASRGRFSYIFSEAVPNGVPGHWRAQFDFTVEGTEPVDMRLYLKNGDQTLTETWLYQYQPF